MSQFAFGKPNTFGWAELNARGVADVVPFYEKVFGWTTNLQEFDPSLPPYRELHQNGETHPGRLGDEPRDSGGSTQLLADLLQRR